MSDVQAVAALDLLIDQMLAAGNEAALVALVTANVMALDVKYFLRLAARADGAPEEDRARLAALADRTMRLVDGIVRRTKSQMTDSSAVLTKLVAAAADDGTGAFVLPLRPDRVARLRDALAAAPVDEAVLSLAFAWMRKANEDGMEGMVAVVQRVLQLWAAQALELAPSSAGSDAEAEALLKQLLRAAPEEWPALLGGAQRDALGRALQARMEGVVLGEVNGSYKQRVLAEFLKELERAVKA